MMLAGLGDGRSYALVLPLDIKLCPCSPGSWRVCERSGRQSIAGLYNAGRGAVSVASCLHLSGCVSPTASIPAAESPLTLRSRHTPPSLKPPEGKQA